MHLMHLILPLVRMRILVLNKRPLLRRPCELLGDVRVHVGRVGLDGAVFRGELSLRLRLNVEGLEGEREERRRYWREWSVIARRYRRGRKESLSLEGRVGRTKRTTHGVVLMLHARGENDARGDTVAVRVVKPG